MFMFHSIGAQSTVVPEQPMVNPFLTNFSEHPESTSFLLIDKKSGIREWLVSNLL